MDIRPCEFSINTENRVKTKQIMSVTSGKHDFFRFDSGTVEMKDCDADIKEYFEMKLLDCSLVLDLNTIFLFDNGTIRLDETETESFIRCYDENSKMALCKKAFFDKARLLRSFAQHHFDFGTAGSFGGVDGEFRSTHMFPIIQRLLTESEFVDENRYGVDLGSGSGIADFSYFNFGAALPMIGIECNDMRYLYSVRLQVLMSTSSEYQQISKMSILYHGNAADILKAKLSSRPVLLWVVYWFREGWSIKDIEEVAVYLNNLPNLEWIIVDLSFADLCSFGYGGSLRSESIRYRGPLSKSSNSRTLFMHHVSQAADYYDRSCCCQSEGRERATIKLLGTDFPIDHAKREILQIECMYGSRKRVKTSN
jgi:hypothetical protein